MIKFTCDKVLLPHQRIIEETGSANEDVTDAGLRVADGSMKHEDLLRWVHEHKQ